MRLYIDTDVGKLVDGANSSIQVGAPDLYAGDLTQVELHFLARTGDLDPFYEYVDVSNYTSIVLAVGEVGGTPVASCSTWFEVAILIVERVKGATGVNEIQRVTIDPHPGAGTFTLTFGANTTGAIAYNASAATITAALEALASIGAGNATATEVADYTWDVEFKGALAATDVAALTGSVANLTGAVGILYGMLNLTGAAVDTLLGSDDSVDTTLEIQIEPDTTTRSTVIQEVSTLYQDLVEDASCQPCDGCQVCDSCESCDTCQNCDACQSE